MTNTSRPKPEFRPARRKRRKVSGESFFTAYSFFPSFFFTFGAGLLLRLVLLQPFEGRGGGLDVELVGLGVAPLDRQAREEHEALPRLEAAQELRERPQ